MKKLWNKIQNAISTVIALLILGAIILVPITIAAQCIQYWINLFS